MINGNPFVKRMHQGSANLLNGKHISVFYVCTTLILIFIIPGIEADHDQSYERPRRDLFSFALMLASKVKRNLLDFLNYGNYCGVLGSGDPLDNIDKCCQTHDHCYENSVHPTYGKCANYGRHSFYWVPYKWDKINDTINCDQYNGFMKDCQHFLCECDKAIVLCLQKTSNNYNTSVVRPSSLWRILQYYVMRKPKN